MKLFSRWSLVALLVALSLLAAACGGADSEEGAPLAPAGSEVPGELPVNPNPEDTPAISGACVEGEPDCQDTLVGGEEPIDLPPPGDDVAPTGMLVDGGLTVADALASGGEETMAVMGFLIIDSDGARLCELLAESLPPQCGGVSVPIADYEEALSVPLTSAQGVSWTDQPASFIGQIVDGTFVVDPFAL